MKNHKMKQWKTRWICAVPLTLAACMLQGQFIRSAPAQNRTNVQQIPVVFSGGHQTDPRDRGRPVVLIAAALGVPAEVFRDAFSRVRPAPAGTRPTREQERRNKAVLLAALARYGVTNERLDEVSNFYRYNRSRGEMWPTRPATAYALMQQNRITGFVVEDGGAGYSSPPTVHIPGFPNINAAASLEFGQETEQNGSVSQIAWARR